jgi:HAD superfamily hydrolase (TIGR01509 family)
MGPYAVFPATLFDFNGVLVDDEHVHLDAFRDTLAPLGISLTEEDYWKKYLGFDDVGAFEAILKDAGRSASADDVAALVEAKRPHYLERAKTALKSFPGAAELIAQRAGLGPVAVVSGALRDEIELGLNHLQARHHVQHIVAAEDTTASKPNPEGYRMAVAWVADRIGSDGARRALVIEDSLAGIQAAKAIGLPCVAVAHSYSKEELGGSQADVVVDRIADITPALLGELYQRLYG